MDSSTKAISCRNLETASTIRAEAITGSHLFRVFGYSLIKEIGSGKSYKSGVFTVGGYNWIIKYYPNGKGMKNYIAFFLRLVTAATDVKARVTFTMLQQNGVPSDMSGSQVKTFKSIGDTQFICYIERTKLEASECLKDDAFTIKCTVTLMKGYLEVFDPDDVIVPASSLSQHFVNLLESGKGADVTFSVNGKRLKAHRCVLAARSSVFNAMLFGCMKEKWEDTITVEDIEAPVFKSMLYFIYSDSLPDFEGSSCDDGEKQNLRLMAQHLLVAADRYDLERLRLMCEDLLCKNLDISKVATTVVWAEQYNCCQLKAKCLKFLKLQN